MSIESFQEAKDLLNNRNRKRIANNTYAELSDDGQSVGIRLHDTIIVQWSADDSCKLDSGGWRTVTTKDRMNQYMPPGFYLSQNRKTWYLQFGGWNGEQWLYADGMTIEPGGTVKGAASETERKAIDKLRKQVKRYAKGFVSELSKGNIPIPSGGDCWYCSMREVGTGTPLGELGNGSADHLQSHIDESYYVPSLLVRIVETQPVSIAAKSWIGSKLRGSSDADFLGGIVSDQVYKAIVRYFERHLIGELYQSGDSAGFAGVK